MATPSSRGLQPSVLGALQMLHGTPFPFLPGPSPRPGCCILHRGGGGGASGGRGLRDPGGSGWGAVAMLCGESSDGGSWVKSGFDPGAGSGAQPTLAEGAGAAHVSRRKDENLCPPLPSQRTARPMRQEARCSGGPAGCGVEASWTGGCSRNRLSASKPPMMGSVRRRRPESPRGEGRTSRAAANPGDPRQRSRAHWSLSAMG